MKAWSDNTCITFVERNASQHNYILIKTGDLGCYSNYVGYSGKKQVINLQLEGCTYTGTIAHELGHNLGLWHEQSRPDRDKYIRVNMENVVKEDRANFMKMPQRLVDTHKLAYDYDSVMHYNSYAFSKNGEPTIEVIESNAEYKDEGYPVIGQRSHLSQGDIEIVNKMYECPAR